MKASLVALLVLIALAQCRAAANDKEEAHKGKEKDGEEAHTDSNLEDKKDDDTKAEKKVNDKKTKSKKKTSNREDVPPPKPYERRIAENFYDVTSLDKSDHAPHHPNGAPKMPLQYTLTMEVTRKLENRTYHVRQYVDLIAGRVRTDSHADGMLTSVIKDFSRRVVYGLLHPDVNGPMELNEFDPTQDICVIQALPDDYTPTIMEARQTRGLVDVFLETTGQEETVSSGFVRGIACDTWRTTAHSEGLDTEGERVTVEAHADHFFSSKTWDVGNERDESYLPWFGDGTVARAQARNDPLGLNNFVHSRVPLQSILRGKIFKATDGSLVSKYVDTYSYVGFVPGVPAAHFFEPGNMVCSGPAVNDEAFDIPIPTLPTQLSTVVETNILEDSYTTVVEEMYDYDNQRSKFSTRSPTTQTREIEIDFYDTGTQFHLSTNTTTGATMCSTTAIQASIQSMGVGDMDGTTGKMKQPSDIFQFGSDFPEHYVGQARVRGILCDKWVRTVADNLTVLDLTTLEYSETDVHYEVITHPHPPNPPASTTSQLYRHLVSNALLLVSTLDHVLLHCTHSTLHSPLSPLTLL
jgi:hypothetical protein